MHSTSSVAAITGAGHDTIIIAQPAYRAGARSAGTTPDWLLTSMPCTGSIEDQQVGFTSSAQASSTRWVSPPHSPCIGRCSRCATPASRAPASRRSGSGLVSIMKRRTDRGMFSSRLSRCGIADLQPGRTRHRALGRFEQAQRRRTSVVLPAPLGPMIVDPPTQFDVDIPYQLSAADPTPSFLPTSNDQQLHVSPPLQRRAHPGDLDRLLADLEMHTLRVAQDVLFAVCLTSDRSTATPQRSQMKICAGCGSPGHTADLRCATTRCTRRCSTRKIQCAVDGRRRFVPVGRQLLEDLIGAARLWPRQDQFGASAPGSGQAQALRRAKRLRIVQRVVDAGAGGRGARSESGRPALIGVQFSGRQVVSVSMSERT